MGAWDGRLYSRLKIKSCNFYLIATGGIDGKK